MPLQNWSSSHTLGSPAQLPSPQVSFRVQGLLSSQGSVFGMLTQRPLVESHESSVQRLWSSQSTGVPAHCPSEQASSVVQPLPASHAPAAGRHTVLADSKASAGQLLVVPSHVSATSHTPAAGRHTAVLLASAGQLALEPVQFSARSHTPAEGRHSVVGGSKTSAG